MDEALAEKLKVYCGICPDQACLSHIYYWPVEETVDCDKCLQTHDIESLSNRHEADIKLKPLYPKPKVATDFIKVNGLSNFRCKLLSPLLTTYGMDKSGNIKLLKDLGHAENIDCGKVLGSRSFMISPQHINIKGYGKDCTGSLDYLKEFFDLLKDVHNNEERLVAIHADGDGHCLVHALSRALIGRELFWHGLRRNLQDHLKQRLDDYMELFKDFHDKEEWSGIIEEADPNCTSSGKMTAGLGNIHIFALSNILKRPVLLFDSPQKIQSLGDYTGLFVPALTEPSECANRSPLCIAWSGAAHNHFVALVAVEGRALPTIPAPLIPRLWGVTAEVADRYLDYNEDGSLTVCDGKPIRVSYLQKLTLAMEKEFIVHNFVAPSLVEDLYRCCYYMSDLLAVQPDECTRLASRAVMEKRLFRCLNCQALQEVAALDWKLAPGGSLYELAVKLYDKLEPNKFYNFPRENAICEYNEELNELVLVNCVCRYCEANDTRHVDLSGKVCYINGDQTETLSAYNGKKYYWNGNEYDNKPLKYSLTIALNKKQIKAPITWFYGDSNPELNSDPMEQAKLLLKRYFPEELYAEDFKEYLADAIACKCHELQTTGKKFVETSSNNSVFKHSPTLSRKRSYGNQEDTNERMETDGDSNMKTLPPVKTHPDQLNNGGHGSTSQFSSSLKSGADVTISEEPSHFSEVEACSSVVVKICMGTNVTKTLKLDCNVDLNELQKVIFEVFGLHPDQQVLKHGFPPKFLIPPDDGGSLSLKSGDKIYVSKKILNPNTEERKQLLENKLNEMKQLKPVSQKFDKTVETKKLLQAASGYPSVWDYAIEKPELFHPGGYFYEEFSQDIGLRPGQPCRFPLLPGHVFFYSLLHNTVQLCLEPAGHFPIDDEIKHVLKKYSNSQSKKSAPENILKLPDGSMETSTSNLSNSSTLAPGFHTVADVPTIPSAEEQQLQRDEILRYMAAKKLKESNS